MKCLQPTHLGDFALKGKELRLKGQNRIGNLIVENKNYCEFEDWLKVSSRRRWGVCTHTQARNYPNFLQISAILARKIRS